MSAEIAAAILRTISSTRVGSFDCSGLGFCTRPSRGALTSLLRIDFRLDASPAAFFLVPLLSETVFFFDRSPTYAIGFGLGLGLRRGFLFAKSLGLEGFYLGLFSRAFGVIAKEVTVQIALLNEKEDQTRNQTQNNGGNNLVE